MIPTVAPSYVPDGYHFEFTVPLESRENARQELNDRGLEFEG